MASYRIYYSGDDRLWMVQEIDACGQIRSTVAAPEVLIHVPCHLPPPTLGARPNGVLRVEGRAELQFGPTHRTVIISHE